MQLRDRSRKFIGPSPTNASSDGMSGKSSAVTTARTPGSFSAFDASIDTMRACACGERFTLPHSMPGHHHVGAELRATGDLVDAVGTDRTGADDSQIGANIIHRTASPRISAAVSITARMILS